MNFKFSILTVFASALIFVGCAKDDAANDQPAPMTRSAVVFQADEFSHNMLSFADRDELDAKINEVAMMSMDEKMQWLASNAGFMSMSEAMRIVSAQMVESGSKDAVIEIQRAYSDVFLFDPSTVEVVAMPFAKSDRPGYEYVCNAYGEVEVAGEVVNLNEFNDFSQTWFAKAQRDEKMAPFNTPNPATSITMQSPYNKFIAASTCNFPPGRPNEAQIFIRYTNLVNTMGTWVPYIGNYTVKYHVGSAGYSTDNQCILQFDPRFKYASLQRIGDQFTTINQSVYGFIDEFVGYARKNYCTGYMIHSARVNQQKYLVVKNNTDL